MPGAYNQPRQLAGRRQSFFSQEAENRRLRDLLPEIQIEPGQQQNPAGNQQNVAGNPFRAYLRGRANHCAGHRDAGWHNGPGQQRNGAGPLQNNAGQQIPMQAKLAAQAEQDAAQVAAQKRAEHQKAMLTEARANMAKALARPNAPAWVHDRRVRTNPHGGHDPSRHFQPQDFGPDAQRAAAMGPLVPPNWYGPGNSVASKTMKKSLYHRFHFHRRFKCTFGSHPLYPTWVERLKDQASAIDPKHAQMLRRGNKLKRRVQSEHDGVSSYWLKKKQRDGSTRARIMDRIDVVMGFMRADPIRFTWKRFLAAGGQGAVCLLEIHHDQTPGLKSDVVVKIPLDEHADKSLRREKDWHSVRLRDR